MLFWSVYMWRTLPPFHPQTVFLREQLVYSLMEKSLCFYLMNSVSLNFFSESTQCPFKYVEYICFGLLFFLFDFFKICITSIINKLS